MFKTMVKKELLDTLLSLRFAVGWIIMLALITAAVLLLSADVKERKDQLSMMEKGSDEFISKYAHENRIGGIIRPFRPPEASEVLFRGLDNPQGESSFFSDLMAKVFPQLDLLFIISVLLPLLGIIFTYDAVCGEREDGTLKLIHTTAISRANVILAKWLGNWLALGVPFMAVFFFAVILGSFVGGLEIDPITLGEAGIIAAASLVYLGFFLALGLFVSGLVRLPGTSILILLFLWVTFALVIPNVSPIIASQITPLPSVAGIEKEAELLTDVIRDNRVQEELQPLDKQFRAQYGIPPSVASINNPIGLRSIGWSEEKIQDYLFKLNEAVRAVISRVNQEQHEKAEALWDELQRRIDNLIDLTRTVSLLSPTSAFIYLGTDIAALGPAAESYYYEELTAFYQTTVRPYVKARTHEIQRETGRPVDANEFIELSNRPRFQHKPQPFEARLDAALPYAGHIVLMTLIALAAAFVAYIRYDVR